MRRVAVLVTMLVTALILAVPAFALEDGIIETSASIPNKDATHADFNRVITNLTEDLIDVAARDLRMPEYPILTVTSMTTGTFDGGIWTVGTLDAGQTASITYTGDTAATTASDVLPQTGQRDNLAAFAFAGLALIVLGVSLLRVARD